MAERFNDNDNKDKTVAAAPNTVTVRDKPPFPMWLLGLIPLVLIGGYLLTRNRNEEAPAPTTQTASDTMRSTPATNQNAPANQVTTPSTNSTNATTSGATSSTTSSSTMETPVTTEAGSGATAGAAGGFTDLAAISSTQDRMTLNGKKATLSSVKVLQVVSDRGFFVGGSDADKTLVFLDAKLDKGKADKAVNIKPGAVLNIAGTLESIPAPEVLAEQYQFRGKEYTDLKKQVVYLHADSLSQVN